MKLETKIFIIIAIIITVAVILTGRFVIDSVSYNMSMCYCCYGVNGSGACSDTFWNGTKCVLGPAGIKSVEDSPYKKECDEKFYSDLGTFT